MTENNNQWDDTKYVIDGKLIRVDHKRWEDAQTFEKECWINSVHLGDDWNFWWREKFDKYNSVENHFEQKEIDILEVGCGPFTNVRLIESIVNYKKVVCSDPLMPTYIKLPCWINSNSHRLGFELHNDQLENLRYANESFDLLICINVLDHVQDVDRCFHEMKRVLKKNGLIVFGQDLTDWIKRDDPNPNKDQDQGHPIRINEEYCYENLKDMKSLLNKVVESRNKNAHYGCLVYIGEKV